MRLLKYLNVLLLAGLVLFAALAWPELPERIPTHFGANGEPDAWADKNLRSWFLLPAVAAFTTALLYLTGWAILRWPRTLNIPSKRQFLELPRADQEPILRFCADCMSLLGTLLLVLFFAIQYATLQAALGQSTRTLMLAVLVLALTGPLAASIVLIARTSALVNEAHRRARARGALQNS